MYAGPFDKVASPRQRAAAVTPAATGVEQKPARSPAAPRPGMPEDGSDACAVGRGGEPDNRDSQEALDGRP